MNRCKALTQIIEELLQAFSAHELHSSSAIAKATGINQSQVHRNLFGEPKRITQTHRRLCIYANVSLEEEAADPRANAMLMDALASTWDGTDGHARRLAELLFAHSRASMRKFTQDRR